MVGRRTPAWLNLPPGAFHLEPNSVRAAVFPVFHLARPPLLPRSRYAALACSRTGSDVSVKASSKERLTSCAVVREFDFV